jgi:hypothetical protein
MSAIWIEYTLENSSHGSGVKCEKPIVAEACHVYTDFRDMDELNSFLEVCNGKTC